MRDAEDREIAAESGALFEALANDFARAADGKDKPFARAAAVWPRVSGGGSASVGAAPPPPAVAAASSAAGGGDAATAAAAAGAVPPRATRLMQLQVAVDLAARFAMTCGAFGRRIRSLDNDE